MAQLVQIVAVFLILFAAQVAALALVFRDVYRRLDELGSLLENIADRLGQT